MLEWFQNEMKLQDKKAVTDKRRDLLKLLNGDVFYSINRWLRVIEKLFWQKPMRDVEVFKTLLFFLGNGCPPTFISQWIMLSQYWSFCEQKCLKRARQIDFIVNNVDNNLNNWYYFDLHVGRQLYLNGTAKIC